MKFVLAQTACNGDGAGYRFSLCVGEFLSDFHGFVDILPEFDTSPSHSSQTSHHPPCPNRQYIRFDVSDFHRYTDFNALLARSGHGIIRLTGWYPFTGEAPDSRRRHRIGIVMKSWEETLPWWARLSSHFTRLYRV